jgi:hypothetical protein
VAEQRAEIDGATPADKLECHAPKWGPGSGDCSFKQPMAVSEAGQADQAVEGEDPPQIVQDGVCIVRIEQVEYECGQHTVGTPLIGRQRQ